MKVINNKPPFEWERLILLFKKLNVKTYNQLRHVKKLCNHFPHFFDGKVPERPVLLYKEKYCVLEMFSKDRIVPISLKPIMPEKKFMKLLAKHKITSSGDLDKRRQVIAELMEGHSSTRIITHYGDDFWKRYYEFIGDERYVDLPGETWKPLVDEYGEPIPGHFYSNYRRISSTFQTPGCKRILKYQIRKTLKDRRKKIKPYREVHIHYKGKKRSMAVHMLTMWQEKPFGVGDNFPPSWTEEDRKEWSTLSESLKRKIMRGLTVDHIDPDYSGYDPEKLQWMMMRDNSSKNDRVEKEK
jgi:hypothetical protein